MPDRTNARWTPVVRVVGQSMEPGLRSGRFLVLRPRPSEVRRGEVVVVARPARPRVVKRVAGVAGDVVELEAGRVRVNGVATDRRARVPGPTVSRWIVPPDSYFVLGDNPSVSDDSRVWPDPFVRHADIAGVALFMLSRMTTTAPRRSFILTSLYGPGSHRG